jgi:hypothetical protein
VLQGIFKVVLKSYREGAWRRSRELSGLRDAAALAPPVLERVIGCRGLAHLTDDCATYPPAVGRVDIGTTLVLLCPHVPQLFRERFPPVLAEATKVRSYTIRAPNSPPRPPLTPTTHRALMPLRPHR